MPWLFQNVDVKGEELRRKVKEGDIAGVIELASETRECMDKPDKKDGWTPLMIASATGKMEIVKFLVQNGADYNMRDPVNGWTAVMCAAAKGKLDIAIWLVQNGADVMIRSNANKSALDVIRDPGKRAILAQAAAANAPVGGGAVTPTPPTAGPRDSSGSNSQQRSPQLLKTNNSPPRAASLAGVSATKLLAQKLASRKKAQVMAQQQAQARAQAKAGITDSMLRGVSAKLPGAAMGEEGKHVAGSSANISVSASVTSPSQSMMNGAGAATDRGTLSNQKDEQRRKLADAVLRNSGGSARGIAGFRSAASAVLTSTSLTRRFSATTAATDSVTIPPTIPVASSGRAPVPSPSARTVRTSEQQSVAPSAAAPDISAMTLARSNSFGGREEGMMMGAVAEPNVQDQLKAYALSKREDSVAPRPAKSSSGELLNLTTLGARDTPADRKQRLHAFLSSRHDSDDSDGGSPTAHKDTRGFYEPPGVTFSDPEASTMPSEPSPSVVHSPSIQDWVQRVRSGEAALPPNLLQQPSVASTPPPDTGFSPQSVPDSSVSLNLSPHAMNTSAGRSYLQERARGEAEEAAANAQVQRSTEKKKREGMAVEKEAKMNVQEWVNQMREGKFSPPPPLKHLGIDGSQVPSPAAMSPMEVGFAPQGSFEELRRDVLALSQTVNAQARSLELYKSTIEEQAHTVGRLTDELKVMMGKQSRLTEEAERMRVKELNALSIVDKRIDEVKRQMQAHLDTAIQRMQEQLIERLHDQMSSTAMDLINGRDAADKALRGEIAGLKTHFSEQIEHHKQLFDQIVTAL